MVKKSMLRNKQGKYRKRRTGISRSLVSVDKQIHKFARTMDMETVAVYDAVLPTHKAYKWRMNDLPNYTEFTNLFDEYRITGVKLKFLYTGSNSNSGTVLTQWSPFVYTVIDNDDAAPLAAVTDYEQYTTCKVNKLLNVPSRFIKPKMSLAAYGGAFTSYTNMQNIWVDSASPGVEYYGFKMGIDTNPLGGAGANLIGRLRVVAKVYLECRSIH